MEYQRLGTTDFKVSKIALGSGALGNKMWGSITESESITTIHKALDSGINFFDTADIYGKGRSEEILAKALGKNRKNIFIATKVGLCYKNKKYAINLSKDYIKQAIEKSLKRLKTDRIDLYQTHWPDLNNPLSGTFEALNECMEEGKIRHIGISNYNLSQIKMSTKHALITSQQVPLNMFKRDYQIQVMPCCYKENIALIAYGPFAKGFLRGDFNAQTQFPDAVRASNPMFNGDTFLRILAIVQRLKQFSVARYRTISQLAIAWVLSHTAVTTTVCEVEHPKQIEELALAVDWHLNQEDLARIELLFYNE